MSRSLALVVMAALCFVAVILLLAMTSYDPGQISGASPAGGNAMGLAGAYAAHGAIRVWGLAAFFIPLVMLGYAWAIWRDRDLDDLGRRLTGAVLLLPVLCGILHLLPKSGLAEKLLAHWDQLQFDGLGGSLGFHLTGAPSTRLDPVFKGGILIRWFDVAGSWLVLLLAGLSALLLLDLGLGRWLRRFWRSLRRDPDESRGGTSALRASSTAPFVPRPDPQPKQRATTSIHEVATRLEKAEKGELKAEADQLIEKIRAHRRELEEKRISTAANTPAQSEPESEAEPSEVVLAPQEAVVPAGTVPAADPPVDEAPPAKRKERTPRPRTERVDDDPEGYVLPPVGDVLDAPAQRRDAEHEAEKAATGRAIEQVFSDFGIGVQVVGAQRGPVVTQYEVRLLDSGMRVQKVEGYEKDLEMKLGTQGIRIVAPLPNKTTIGVEVPNKVKEAVVMRPLVEQVDPAAMALPLVLGRDAVGAPLVSDLAKMPHLLVAGATGMGKSVCMNSIICSVLLFKGPEEVKFIMVDPKLVELAGYDDLPHLLAPVITDMTKAHAALEWACREMDGRYETLKSAGCRNISDYNALGADEVRFRLAKKELRLEDLPYSRPRMPFIVVVVDEYADLMLQNKEVEKSIVRLCSKSRAAGIHVILTTQRPSADVVTGLIKSNLPCRICFRVVDKNNSRVVLDVSGAENLLGKGDMLFLQPGTSLPTRGQGVWLKDKEIEAIVAHAKAQGAPTFEEGVMDVGAIAVEGGAAGGGAAEGGEWLTDRSFHEAVQAMYRYHRTGADFFRRKIGIGYNKATAYVEQLEDLGFVGPQKGTAPREIIKSWDDWIELLKEQGHTWAEDDELYRNPAAVGEG